MELVCADFPSKDREVIQVSKTEVFCNATACADRVGNNEPRLALSELEDCLEAQPIGGNQDNEQMPQDDPDVGQLKKGDAK